MSGELDENKVETVVKRKPQNGKILTDTVLYENILKDIKDMNVLSSYQIYYLRGLSNEKLIKIIEIYNLVIQNVNEIL